MTKKDDVSLNRKRIAGIQSDRYGIDLEETPLETVRLDGIGSCLLKREDFNPTGSHKDRAAAVQIAHLKKMGIKAGVISSSGNAAAALAHRAARNDILIFSFLSVRTPPEKISAVAGYQQPVILTPKPVNHSRYASRIFNLPDLRPSIDPRSVEGFMSLGFEIARQSPFRPDAVFLFTTSGATLLGIAGAFKNLVSSGFWKNLPELHAVQTGKSVGLAGELDPRPVLKSQADIVAGGLQWSRLYPELLEIIRSSGGCAWAVRKNEIENAQEMLEKKGILTSMESAAAVAGACRWKKEYSKRYKILIVITGSRRQPAGSGIFELPNIVRASSYLDVRNYIQTFQKVFS